MSAAAAAGEPVSLTPGNHEPAETTPSAIPAINPHAIRAQGAEFRVLRLDLAPSGSLLSFDKPITGVASFYDDPGETASGEQYDPRAFTAAAQLALRDQFGGIRYGKNYQAAYAVGEYEGKKAIVKFNDVGPLRPGRKFDLSRATMEYFGGIEKGVLADVKMTPLRLGQDYRPGPVTDAQLAIMMENYIECAAAGPASCSASAPDGPQAPELIAFSAD